MQRGRRGLGTLPAPPTRQSRGCRERNARRPGPGHRTPYRTPPSLELGQSPTTIAAPGTSPTGLDSTTNTTSQLRTLLPAPCSLPPALDAVSPFLCPGPDIEPPAGSGDSPLAPQRWTLPPSGPLLSFRRTSFLPSSDRSTSSFSDSLLLGQRCPRPLFPSCSPGCLSPGDCGGFSAAVEASHFCTGTTGTASLAGTETKTRTTRPLS